MYLFTKKNEVGILAMKRVIIALINISLVAIIIIIIVVILKCYFYGEHIALSLKNKTRHKNGVNIELEITNRLNALCMMLINT